MPCFLRFFHFKQAARLGPPPYAPFGFDVYGFAAESSDLFWDSDSSGDAPPGSMWHVKILNMGVRFYYLPAAGEIFFGAATWLAEQLEPAIESSPAGAEIIMGVQHPHPHVACHTAWCCMPVKNASISRLDSCRDSSRFLAALQMLQDSCCKILFEMQDSLF